MEVITLLKKKTRCLQRFHKESEDFLLNTLPKTGFTGLDQFQKDRDKLLKLIQLIDQKLSTSIERLTRDQRTPKLIEMVKQAENLQESIISDIIKLDQKIVSQLESEKDRITQELLMSEKTKNWVNKFKSQWIPESGEKLDGQI